MKMNSRHMNMNISVREKSRNITYQKEKWLKKGNQKSYFLPLLFLLLVMVVVVVVPVLRLEQQTLRVWSHADWEYKSEWRECGNSHEVWLAQANINQWEMDFSYLRNKIFFYFSSFATSFILVICFHGAFPLRNKAAWALNNMRPGL